MYVMYAITLGSVRFLYVFQKVTHLFDEKYKNNNKLQLKSFLI